MFESGRRPQAPLPLPLRQASREKNAHAALAIAHRGYVLETGQVLFSGAAADLVEDPRVVEAYLGV